MGKKTSARAAPVCLTLPGVRNYFFAWTATIKRLIHGALPVTSQPRCTMNLSDTPSSTTRRSSTAQSLVRDLWITLIMPRVASARLGQKGCPDHNQHSPLIRVGSLLATLQLAGKIMMVGWRPNPVHRSTLFVC